MDGLKDTRATTVLSGVVVPFLFLVWAIFNVAAGRAYLPTDRFDDQLLDGMIRVLTLPLQVWGAAVFKVGMALGLHAWFGIANYDRTEHVARSVLVVGIVASVIGLCLFAIGFF